tara:strand:- start:158 stop:415 length:258 start_codon:yes stop_codon:yes gene_type:complete
MSKNLKETISTIFKEVFLSQVEGVPVPEVNDDLILLESGLDSMGFAALVVELEERLGYDPFTISDDAFYPVTFGDFVAFYEKHKP